MWTKLLVAAALTMVGSAAQAQADDGEKAARGAMRSLVPDVVIDQVVKSELPGFYEVVAGGEVIYVSADGKYLLQGNLYEVPKRKNMTETRVAGIRAEALSKLPQTKRIVFAPEHPKHTVTVFTDIDCPYCRQFHKQIAQYNAAGIAVNYVLYPLDSIHPDADKKAVAVWCASDRNSAYTAAMGGQDLGKKTCDNPVAETKALAVRLGINSTPTLLAEDGTHITNGSMMDPQQLSAELDRIAAKSAKPREVADTH